MRRSNSSKRWLQEHFNDHYVKMAQLEGYRSRAIYKLKEVDEKEHLFHPGMTVVDLGAAPGGWTQYVSQKLAGKGKIIALDCLPMAPLPGVEIILGDFTQDAVLDELKQMTLAHEVDVILSDLAPNMSGNAEIDMPRALYLAELAFDFTEQMMKPGGTLLMKVFHGPGFDDLVRLARSRFKRVVIRKPKASRARSRETYLLAKGYNL